MSHSLKVGKIGLILFLLAFLPLAAAKWQDKSGPDTSLNLYTSYRNNFSGFISTGAGENIRSGLQFELIGKLDRVLGLGFELGVLLGGGAGALYMDIPLLLAFRLHFGKFFLE